MFRPHFLGRNVAVTFFFSRLFLLRASFLYRFLCRLFRNILSSRSRTALRSGFLHRLIFLSRRFSGGRFLLRRCFPVMGSPFRCGFLNRSLILSCGFLNRGLLLSCRFPDRSFRVCRSFLSRSFFLWSGFPYRYFPGLCSFVGRSFALFSGCLLRSLFGGCPLSPLLVKIPLFFTVAADSILIKDRITVFIGANLFVPQFKLFSTYWTLHKSILLSFVEQKFTTNSL